MTTTSTAPKYKINDQVNKKVNSGVCLYVGATTGTIIKVIEKHNVRVVIEQVSAMPGQGVTSMFNFGQSFGILKGLCSAMELPMYFVRPARWKKYFNLLNLSLIHI